MRIKKISPTTPANGNIENQYGTSQTNAYSEEYSNTTFASKNIENYSTTETRVGTWIDGKPLYRKIVTGSSTTVDTVFNIPHNISNVDTIMLDATSFIKIGANRFQVNRVPTNYTYPDKNTISTNLNDNYIVLYVGSYLQVSGYSYSFTLLYTKTTD